MTSKLEVAAEQLETAIDLFIGGRFAAAATLAGAAEEIVGKQLRTLGRDNALDSMAEGVARIYKQRTGQDLPKRAAKVTINRSKNALKHMDGSDDSVVYGNLREEAEALIWRALSNYDRLDMPFNKMIAGFPGNARDT